MVAHLGFLAGKAVWLMAVEEVDGAFEVFEKQGSHIGRQTLFDQNALDNDVVGMRWQRASRGFSGGPPDRTGCNWFSRHP